MQVIAHSVDALVLYGCALVRLLLCVYLCVWLVCRAKSTIAASQCKPFYVNYQIYNTVIYLNDDLSAYNVAFIGPHNQEKNWYETTFETLHDAGAIDYGIVTALAQDAHGLIWISTQGGLIRYDGYRFRKFSHKLGDPFSLAGDFVFSIYTAQDGRLWVGTLNDGISVFDPACGVQPRDGAAEGQNSYHQHLG